MHYFVYQITNLINGKIYIGAHRTENLNDEYMGSGNLIKQANKKYGIENFSKIILFDAESVDEMYKKEAELVILGSQSYNLTGGGRRGTVCTEEYRKRQSEYGKKGALISTEKLKEIYGENLNEYYKNNSRKMLLLRREKRPNHMSDMVEKAKSKESIEKRKQTFREIGHQQGEKNSQFGTIWITNGLENNRIRKEEHIPDEWRKGRVMSLMRYNK